MSKRADQLVLRDVGYDNYWRRKFQTIRESTLFPSTPIFERAPFLTRSLALSIHWHYLLSHMLWDALRDLASSLMVSVFSGYAPDYGSSLIRDTPCATDNGTSLPSMACMGFMGHIVPPGAAVG